MTSDLLKRTPRCGGQIKGISAEVRHPRGFIGAAGATLILFLLTVHSGPAAPFDGTGTIFNEPSSYGDRLGFYWDGGVAYRMDRFDSFAAEARVHVQGDLTGDSITVGSITAAGPFQECGRLDAVEFCPGALYCGKYGRLYIIDTFGGFQAGDSVLATLQYALGWPSSECLVWPWWNVTSMVLCDSTTALTPVTWGILRHAYR